MKSNKNRVTVSFLDDLEHKIRLNQAPALKSFSNIRPKNVPRSLVYRYASLMRRMGGVKYALTILNPIVRQKTSAPSNDEIIEYAACLTRLSLIEESIELLKSISNYRSPEIDFELAMANVSKWEYETARAHFKRFLSFTSLNEYRKCVGEINLGACYIYTNETEEATNILKKALNKAKESQFHLLCGNILELLSEIAILQKEYRRAESFLAEAHLLLGSSNPRYLFYLNKWRAIINLLEEKGSPQSIHKLSPLRIEAAKLRDWNNIRELELFVAVATNDLKKITDIYFSVPFPGYRKRILTLWGKELNPQLVYDKKLGPHPQKTGNIFDISKGADLKTKYHLKTGQSLHRLVQCLCSDFYAPFSTTRIFSAVFKDTYFNPISSPQQVYELIMRLNNWFQENNLDLKVMRGEGGYRLRSEKGYILKIPQTPILNPTRMKDFVEALWLNNLTENFSASMVKEKLGLPLRSVTRYLGQATADGILIRQGGGHATRYSRAKK